MHKILNKQIIAINIKRMEIAADVIARRAKPGQFVMVMADSKGEKIPLCIADCDPQRGIMTLIFEETGISTKRLGEMPIGENIFSILGPLGVPLNIGNSETIACVGYGVGVAQLFSIAKAHRRKENKVIGIIGAKTKKALILESQMRLACNKLYVTTEDGSYERRGSIVNILPEVIKTEKVFSVFAVGSLDMLVSLVKLTQERKIKTVVSLNPVMVDGIGLCGSCRVKVGGKDVLACIEGPHFDGHAVDFNDLMIRQ